MRNTKGPLVGVEVLISGIASQTDVAVLERLERCVRERIKQIARMNAVAISVGDQVTFNDRIRPGYLAGLKATVCSVNRESVTVDCPDEVAYGRFKGSKRVRVPLTLVSVLS